MKVAVIGAGAMGLLFGAKLGRAGHEVTMVDVDPQVIDRINGVGIHLEFGDDDRNVLVRAGFAEDVNCPPELAILATKSMNSETALKAAEGYLGPDTVVLTIQNGIENIEIVKHHVAVENIVWGISSYGAYQQVPGYTVSTGMGGIRVLGANGEVTPACELVVETLGAAGLICETDLNLIVDIWERAAVNAALGAVSAICRLQCHGVGGVQEGVALCYQVGREVCEVAHAYGVDASFERVREAMDADLLTAQGDYLAPMAHDVVFRHPTEVDAINGVVVRKARDAGLLAPYNETLFCLIRTIESTYPMMQL